MEEPMADTPKCDRCGEDAVYRDNDTDTPSHLCQSHGVEVALEWMLEASHFSAVGD